VTLSLRPYVDADWEAVLELCLLAFTPGCESFERTVGIDIDWRMSIEKYLRSLVRTSETKHFVVAEFEESIAGIVHYEINGSSRTGEIGVSAVHPARQGQGIGPRMYEHVLGAMRAQGLLYATADTRGDSAHAAARRAYEKVGFVALPTVHYFMTLGDSAPVVRPSPDRKKRRPAASGSTAGRRVRQTSLAASVEHQTKRFDQQG
jgi:ribosomal protein S18 acetylase RimI-like enzyme